MDIYGYIWINIWILPWAHGPGPWAQRWRRGPGPWVLGPGPGPGPGSKAATSPNVGPKRIPNQITGALADVFKTDAF